MTARKNGQKDYKFIAAPDRAREGADHPSTWLRVIG